MEERKKKRMGRKRRSRKIRWEISKKEYTRKGEEEKK